MVSHDPCLVCVGEKQAHSALEGVEFAHCTHFAYFFVDECELNVRLMSRRIVLIMMHSRDY